jgi:AcrR family transcriptional regulator
VSNRREQLLDTAESILERDRLEGFGITAIARAVGVKPPSLYKHFSGIAEIEHALISRWFRRVGAALDVAEERSLGKGAEARIRAFAEAYRSVAQGGPQLYRLATERALERGLLEPGVETAAMSAVLRFFGETPEQHDRARLVWAAAHGLVALEAAGRFPPGADLEAGWEGLVRVFSD